jgi:hypothetical protein
VLSPSRASHSLRIQDAIAILPLRGYRVNYMRELDTALYAQLSTTATTLYGIVSTRVFNGRAPQPTSKPYVVYNYQGGGLLNDTPLDFDEVLYQVKGLAPAVGAANDIDAAIWERLHNQQLSVSGWTCVSCMRETEVQFEEEVNQATVFHRGALYRIRLSK